MKRKMMNRRQFLRLAGITLGACALSCAGLTLFAEGEVKPEHPLPVGFPDLTLEQPQKRKKVLVAYASAAGSTGGVAETIGRALADGGEAVDIRPIQSVTDLSPYRAVILGSAIHGGKWLPEAVSFLKDHQDAMRQVPAAFFLVGMMAASRSESTRALVAEFLAAERALVKPVAEGHFTGAMFLDRQPFFTSLGMRFFLAYCGLGLRGGDYRDPHAIREWTAKLQPLLAQQS